MFICSALNIHPIRTENNRQSARQYPDRLIRLILTGFNSIYGYIYLLHNSSKMFHKGCDQNLLFATTPWSDLRHYPRALPDDLISGTTRAARVAYEREYLQINPISCTSTPSGSIIHKCSNIKQVLQVPGRGSLGCFSDGNILSGIHPSFESIRTKLKHAPYHF